MWVSNLFLTLALSHSGQMVDISVPRYDLGLSHEEMTSRGESYTINSFHVAPYVYRGSNFTAAPALKVGYESHLDSAIYNGAYITLTPQFVLSTKQKMAKGFGNINVFFLCEFGKYFKTMNTNRGARPSGLDKDNAAFLGFQIELAGKLSHKKKGKIK